MTPLKANTFISFILLFVLLLLSGGAASQRRRAKVAPPNIQRTDTLQVGDSLQMGDSCKGKGASCRFVATRYGSGCASQEGCIGCPVAYEANDSIVFTQSGFAHLYGQGKVSYPGADLRLMSSLWIWTTVRFCPWRGRFCRNSQGKTGLQRRGHLLRNRYYPL